MLIDVEVIPRVRPVPLAPMSATFLAVVANEPPDAFPPGIAFVAAPATPPAAATLNTNAPAATPIPIRDTTPLRLRTMRAPLSLGGASARLPPQSLKQRGAYRNGPQFVTRF